MDSQWRKAGIPRDQHGHGHCRCRQVGEDRRACPARVKLNGEVAGHADILVTILARKSASMSVSVPWNSSLNYCGDHAHGAAACDTAISLLPV